MFEVKCMMPKDICQERGRDGDTVCARGLHEASKCWSVELCALRQARTARTEDERAGPLPRKEETQRLRLNLVLGVWMERGTRHEAVHRSAMANSHRFGLA